VQEYRYLGTGNTKALERIARASAGAGAIAGVSAGASVRAGVSPGVRVGVSPGTRTSRGTSAGRVPVLLYRSLLFSATRLLRPCLDVLGPFRTVPVGNGRTCRNGCCQPGTVCF